MLIAQRVPLPKWPAGVRRALGGALTRTGDAIEDEKAEHLSRHLFGGLDYPEPDPAMAHDAPAERLRADLAGLVDAGAGLDLVPPEAFDRIVAA